MFTRTFCFRICIPFLLACAEAGIFQCNPEEGWIEHVPSGWKIVPSGISWSGAVWTIEGNYNETAARLTNVTLGNRTNIAHLFKMAGKELPKTEKIPLAAAKDTSEDADPADTYNTKASLRALANKAEMPALKDKEDAASKQNGRDLQGSPASQKSLGANSPESSKGFIPSQTGSAFTTPDRESKKSPKPQPTTYAISKPQIVQGPDGVWRLTKVSSPAAAAAAEPSETTEPKPETLVKPAAAAQQPPCKAGNGLAKGEPASPVSVPESAQLSPPASPATSIYPSDEEEQSPVLRSPRSRRKLLFLSPPQKNLRRLRTMKSI